MSAQELALLPHVSSGAIVEALNAALHDFSMPHQLLLNLNPLLGKLSSKDKQECRTICKTIMLYRIMTLCDEQVDSWADKLIHENFDYDTSGKNRSALKAALVRSVLAEIAYELGNHVAATFFYLRSFLTP